MDDLSTPSQLYSNYGRRGKFQIFGMAKIIYWRCIWPIGRLTNFGPLFTIEQVLLATGFDHETADLIKTASLIKYYKYIRNDFLKQTSCSV